MAGQGGVELEVAPRTQAGKADVLVELAEEAVAIAVGRVVGDAVAHVARPGAAELDAPGELAAAAGEADLLERDRDLDGVAVLVDAACRGPDEVERPVLAAGAVDGVGLHAQRVDAELVGAALVVEGVEEDDDVVVLHEGVDRVAVHQVGADLLRLGIMGAEGDVDVVAVVGDEALGSDRRLDVVARRPLVADWYRGRRLPGGLVEDAVDLDLRGGAGDREGLAGVRRCGSGGLGRRLSGGRRRDGLLRGGAAGKESREAQGRGDGR